MIIMESDDSFADLEVETNCPMVHCSGLMEMDTLMRDNVIVTDRGVYERKESL